jgi:hypothetical protein
LALLIPLVRQAWLGRPVSHVLRIFLALALSAFALAIWRIPLFGIADWMLAIAVTFAASERKSHSSPPKRTNHGSAFSWWWLSPVTLLPGLILVWPTRQTQPAGTFTPSEWQALVLRDVAHELATREPHAIVLASPAISADLAYAGDLGTLIDEKSHSAESALRICESTTAEEAQRLLEAHHVRYLVFPSWDLFFHDVAHRDDRAFIEQLHRWNLPAWLRPLPYFLPPISGDIRTRVTIFELVPDQDDAASVANLAEYFLETNSLDHARELRATLDRFPTDLAAMTAELEIEIAEDPAAIAKEKKDAIADSIHAKADENLSLDQCARLALDLARIGRDDLAHEEAARCTEGFTHADVLALTPRALLRFMALSHYYHLQFKDDLVEQLAWRLLPPGSREKVYSN